MSLSDITILVTSMLRPGYLRKCLKRIAANLPECKVIVVDDSLQCGDKDCCCSPVPPFENVIQLPFDSGLTVKRNAGVKAIKTKYTLLGSDDFDFGTKECREGILKLLSVLERNPHIDIASGRHNNVPYEGFTHVEPGKYIKETRLVPNGAPFQKCDITVNYFLARTETLREVPWDEDIVPIGGEHGQFFLHLKEAGKTVVWAPGVNINSLPASLAGENDPRYSMLRGRAVTTGHKIFLAKRGVTNYYGFADPAPRAQARPVVVANPILPVEPSANAKPLILVMSCFANYQRIQEIRETWLDSAEAAGVDVRFFVGHKPVQAELQSEVMDDVIFVDVSDDYNSLPLKVQAAFKWALDNGYTHGFKVDDDTLVIPSRLRTSGFEQHDYIGRVNAARDGHYMSGGSGYWLSAKAMKLVAEATHNGDWAEDRFVGLVLRSNGIKPHHDPRYTLYPFKGESLTDFITACNIVPNLVSERRMQPATVTLTELYRAFKSTSALPLLVY